MIASRFWAVIRMVLVIAIGAGRSWSQTMLVSVSSSGEPANDSSYGASLSADGRFVAFGSVASNLVPRDSNGGSDAFLHDRATGRTTCLSHAPDGAPSNGLSYSPLLAANGRFVVFSSTATNLDATPIGGLFVADVDTGTLTRVQSFSGVDSYPSQFVAISADGRYVGYTLFIWQEPHLRVHELATGREISIGSPEPFIDQWITSISEDGRYVTFVRGSFGNRYTLIFDRETLTTVDAAASLHPNEEVVGWMSSDARTIFFESRASNLLANDRYGTDLFARDFPDGPVSLVSLPDSGFPATEARATARGTSATGRRVVFHSRDTLGVPGDVNGRTDVFVRDRLGGSTTCVSTNPLGLTGDRESEAGAISADGRFAAFSSRASDLVEGDTNSASDVFVRELPPFLDISDVEPSTGSESGGDLVHVRYSSARVPTSVGVSFGGSPAEIVQVGADEVTVRTPPGIGVVDVSVAMTGDGDLRRGAFEYVEPLIAARFGNVHVGRGDREDVLLVNAFAGERLTREVRLGVGEPSRFVVATPSSRALSRFVVYAWRGLSRRETLTPIGGGLGSMVFPTPFTAGFPQPIAIWNTLGFRRTLGTPTLPSSPAPTTLLDRASGFSNPLRVTFQGLIQDDDSPTAAGISVTNAILLRVDP